MSNNMVVSLSLVLLLALPSVVKSGTWTYADPSSWKEKNCHNGKHQSPLDLRPPFRTSHYPPLIYHAYDRLYTGWKMLNNGHTVEVMVPEDLPSRPYISGGNLPDDYELAQFHFHWSQYDQQGSEHAIDGKHYPLEMHFVHLGKRNNASIAVVAVFFELGISHHASALKDIRALLPRVALPDSSTTMPFVYLNNKLPKERQTYLRYDGSLTTPPCTEHVIWTVYQQPLIVTEAQLGELREMENTQHEKININDRPVQALNHRTIWHNRPLPVQKPNRPKCPCVDPIRLRSSQNPCC